MQKHSCALALALALCLSATTHSQAGAPPIVDRATLQGSDSALAQPVAFRGGFARGGVARGGFARGGFARGGAVTRRTVAVGPRGAVVGRRTTVVGRGGVYRGGAVVRRGAWVRPGGYWWRPGGAIAAGAAIGFVTAATAASWAGAAPGPNMCWYYTDPSRTKGFWDTCR